MRIAHVNQDPGTAPDRQKGAAVHVLEMRRAFRALGSDVVAIDTPDPDAAAGRLEAELVRGVDLIYERDALNSGAAFSFARERRIPFVLEVNSPLEEEERLYRDSAALPRATTRAEERESMYREANLVLGVSSEAAEYARRRGAAPERILVQPNAVDPERFAPRRPDDPLRAELVPAGRFALGFHGRLRPWHHLGLLVEACDELLAEGRPAHLLLIGKGEFESLLGARPAGRHCTIRDWVPHAEVGAYVACFDALPLCYDPHRPAYYSPLKLYEAMAAGVVPVVPRLGDLATCVEDGRDGLHYAAGDARSLADAIRGLMDAPDRTARLALRARERALGHTWAGVARRVLERALGGSPA